MRIHLSANPEDPHAACTEAGLQVWRFDSAHGDQYWVAAANYDEAMEHILTVRKHTPFPDHGHLEKDLDAGGFEYGDSDEGDVPVPCTLRQMVRWELGKGKSAPILLAETR